MCEAKFGCIVRMAEHRFTEKHSSDSNTIKPAYQFIFALLFAPHFHRVSEAHLMKSAISRKHVLVDPGAVRFGSCSRAMPHHLFKVVIKRYTVNFFAQRFL